MLQARDITVSYHDRLAVAAVSFSLAEGEILAIVGANGAGKSTLLKTLNASIDYKGTIELNGKDLAHLSRRDIAKQIAVVAQENETRFPITVLEFVLAGRFVHGGAFGWESDEDIDAARQSIKDCGLADFESRLINQLSGGERQRVVLARALATGAKVLLLDEPTANLDLAQQAKMLRLVRARCSDGGHSAIVITHDLNLAAAYADQVIALKAGKVLAKGSPAEAITAESVKGFLGIEVVVDKQQSGSLRISTIY